MVHAALVDAQLGEIIAPDPLDRQTVLRVHDADYVAFLEGFWQRWCEGGRDETVRDAFPFVWPTAGLRRTQTRHIDGLMGRYSFDAGTPMGAGTWTAASASAATAQTAARRVASGLPHAFALCRPPGHHAMPDAYGGYCFLNNAAIAAQTLRDEGAERVAIIDVDYHHGNGTQAIFYDRKDVFFASIHADPMDEYPYFLGHSDEIGEGEGQGFNLNIPIPFGTLWPDYANVLSYAMAEIVKFKPDAFVISLGLDTFEGDPISQFALKSVDFQTLGGALAGAGVPTVIVFEGGYAVDDLATNTLNVLTGFLDRHTAR
jgi:acetoin utilization deacetylase AcuC-like enzyme